MHFNISKLQEGIGLLEVIWLTIFFNDLKTLLETVIDGYERKEKEELWQAK